MIYAIFQSMDQLPDIDEQQIAARARRKSVLKGIGGGLFLFIFTNARRYYEDPRIFPFSIAGLLKLFVDLVICLTVGYLLGLRSSKEDLVKVVIEIPEGEMGVETERVCAVSRGNDLYEIRNSPWYARNVNWGDWVKAIAPSQKEWPVFESVVKRNGHRTIQIFFFEPGMQRATDILEEINRLGASYEQSGEKMYALDCAPGMDVDPLIAYLSEMKTIDALDFRTNAHS